MYGTRRESAILISRSAVISACFSSSMAHGPPISASGWCPPILRRPATTTSRVIGSDGVARGPKRGWPGLGARRFRSSFGILVSERRLHESGEERVRIPGPRAELGMELAGHEVGMLGQLDDLDELLLGPQAGDAQPVLLELWQVVVVDLVAVAV